MEEGEKDLASAFVEVNREIKQIKSSVQQVSDVVLNLAGMTVEELKTGRGKTDSAPFVKSVIALIKRTGAKTTEELLENLEAMTGQVFIDAEDAEDCKNKGGEWDEENKRCLKKTGETQPIYMLPLGDQFSTGESKAKRLAEQIMGED